MPLLRRLVYRCLDRLLSLSSEQNLILHPQPEDIIRHLIPPLTTPYTMFLTLLYEILFMIEIFKQLAPDSI